MTEETKEDKKEFSVSSLVGLTKDTAISTAKEAGYKTRIVKEDDKTYLISMDFKDNRVNLTIKNGSVEKATIG